MPALVPVRPRERLIAFAAVAVVQLGLGLALLFGLRVDILSKGEFVSRLIDVALPRPPPPPSIKVSQPRAARHRSSAAPKAQQKPSGGSPGPVPSHVMPAPTPVVAVHPSAPASGGGSGTGPALGSGAGGGSGGKGYGSDDEGGTDLVQIAGEIDPSDYPRDLRERGIGGRVGIVFTVGTDGRVTSCTVTRSSGVPELDALTCRLIQQRFRYRPSTDRYGRPIPDEVEGEHDWVAARG
ncbi:MAG TPA: TonB family protein [Sphingomicrobium sp.]|jgi:protein TonB|nr:TonB family protein [Sphingomicrobium sp.]